MFIFNIYFMKNILSYQEFLIEHINSVEGGFGKHIPQYNNKPEYPLPYSQKPTKIKHIKKSPKTQDIFAIKQDYMKRQHEIVPPKVGTL